MKEIIIQDGRKIEHKLEGYVRGSTDSFVEKVRGLENKKCENCGQELLEVKGNRKFLRKLTRKVNCKFIIKEDGGKIGFCSYKCLREYLDSKGRKSW